MPITLPSNLTYGTITGKFLLTALDSLDADRYPDYIAAIGTVTFTPAVASYKNLFVPATFITSPVVCTIDTFGDMRDPLGALGVVLVATDNADLQPRDWTYQVTVSASGQTYSFPITVTGGATIDLTAVAPAAPSSGTAIVVSSADRIAAEAAADAAAQSAIDAAAAAGGGLNIEGVQDAVGAMTSGTGYVSVTYNDGAGTLVIASTSALTTDLAAKATDTAVVHNTGTENVAGVKTFTSIPVLPASDPTTANQAARKAYVDGLFNNTALTGNPTAPTPSAGDNDTSIATTAFVKSERPAMTFAVIYNSPNWTYKGSTITARPTAMQTGDQILFIGNPGGALPLWAASNDIWTQG